MGLWWFTREPERELRGPEAQPGTSQAAEAAAAASACPASDKARRQLPIYDVYNRRIDEGARAAGVAERGTDARNNIPLGLNQSPAPGQRCPLSTERATSTIPKGGTDATWVYPSPQMFYNALHRKGKADDLPEGDARELEGVLGAVVHSHNSMNERTWRAVQRWERLHPQTADDVQLNRFVGRPDDLSPLAHVRTLLGGGTPFDRHDWYVRRGDAEVRYVIDFYFHEHLAGSPQAFEIVDRPALDSVTSVMDRVKMAIYKQCHHWGVPCPVTGHHALHEGDKHA